MTPNRTHGNLIATYRDIHGMPMIESGHDKYIREELQKLFPGIPLYFLTDYYPEDESKSPLRLVSFSNNWTTTYKTPPNPKFKHLEKIRKKEAYFVYEIYTESGQGYVPHLYSICKKFDIPTEQAILLGSSYDYKMLALKFAKVFKVKPVNVFVYNFFERNVKRRLLLDHHRKLTGEDSRTITLPTLEANIANSLDIPNPLYGDHEKTFIFLNHVPRPHRCAMLALLYTENLLDKGYVSFHYQYPYVKDDEKTTNWDKIFNFLTNHFEEPMRDMILKGKEVLKDLPMRLDDIEVELNPAVMSHVSLESYMQSSFFSLVAETFFSYNKQGFIHQNGNQECRFVTEKTFKCFAYKHPFILISLPNTLEVLRELGYKTFDGIIDESYDKEENDTVRFIKILHEVKRLSNLDQSTLSDYKKKLIPIVEHNFNVFINKKQYIKDLRYWGSRSVI